MRAWVLGVLLTACYRAPATPAHPAQPLQAQTEIESSALVDIAPPTSQHAVIATGKQSLWVGGCNTSCVDCWLGSYQTYVVGTLTRTGAKLFPIEPLAPGYQCGAEVRVGERVTLRAHSPTEHMTIVSWNGFFDRDSCPCEGSTAQTCTFEVTPEIASQSDRIYCGAAWKQKATAQIGR